MATKNPTEDPGRNGNKNKKDHLKKAGTINPENGGPKKDSEKTETPVQKIERMGETVLRAHLSNHLKINEISASQIASMKKQCDVFAEFEEEILDPNFRKSLEPETKINLYKVLSANIHRGFAFHQNFFARPDVIISQKSLVRELVFLEQDKAFREVDLPYSPGFRAKVRAKYAEAVLGRKAKQQSDQQSEEEDDGSEELE